MEFTTLPEKVSEIDVEEVVKHFKFSSSELGGNKSYFVHLSLDKKEDWVNNIFHNSRYAIFSISNGKVELISKGLNMPKFRKSNIKSEQNLAEKIVNYCKSA